MKNLGLILEQQKPQDWILGGFSPLSSNVTNPSGQWDAYLPEIEYQNKGFERMACVSYSLLNCLEILYLHQVGVSRNFSDRFLAKMSNTTHAGNYLTTVFDTARKFGLVDESVYPDVLTGWDDYYKPIPQEIQNTGMDFLLHWDLYREWIYPYQKDKIIYALKESPLQVIVAYAGGDGILNPKGNYNHAVMVYGYDEGNYWKIFDHYDKVHKKYAWDYEFGQILKPTLTNKIKPMNLKQNALVFKANGGGKPSAIHIDGKLFVDDEEKVLFTWTMRNSDFNNKKTVTEADFNSLPHYNLKGEKI